MRGAVDGTSRATRSRSGSPPARRAVDPFTYDGRDESNKQRADPRRPRTTRACSSDHGRRTGTAQYLDYYTDALRGRGHRLRRLRRRRARPHRARARSACSSHYKAIIWYTGDDLYVARARRQPRRHAAPRSSFDDEILASRDYLNEGGKLARHRQERARGRVGAVPLQPARAAPPQAVLPANSRIGQGDCRRPAGPDYNCVAVSNDFLQY